MIVEKMKGKSVKLDFEIDDRGTCMTACPFDRTFSFDTDTSIRVASMNCKSCPNFSKVSYKRKVVYCRGKI